MQDTKPNPSLEFGLHPVPAVGIVCWREDEILLIRRRHAPHKDMWSIPGGRVQPSETLIDAALRELREETGVTAQLCGLIAVYDLIEPSFHYILIDYAAVWTGGILTAGDDATEASFVHWEDAIVRVVQPDLVEAILRSRSLVVGANPT